MTRIRVCNRTDLVQPEIRNRSGIVIQKATYVECRHEQSITAAEEAAKTVKPCEECGNGSYTIKEEA